jgi:hypothetical protein
MVYNKADSGWMVGTADHRAEKELSQLSKSL